jgi:hypothetical protein
VSKLIGTTGHLTAAAENNALWCDLVCRANGIETAIGPGHWTARERTPRLYPDAVTLRPGVAAADVLLGMQDGPGASVKDSFADLDLAPHGYDVLFEASWVFREPAAPDPASGWTQVDAAEWVHAAGGPEPVRHVHDTSVRFFLADGGGAVANRTGSVVGVSNVFAESLDEVWAGIPGAFAAVFPGLPLVGYEEGEALRAAVKAGFADIGPLRIWLRP